MCIGYDPLVSTMPYLISGIISVVITILLYTLPIIKKLNPKYLKIVRIIMIIISVILLLFSFAFYNLNAVKNC